jgi:hypothetical protein
MTGPDGLLANRKPFQGNSMSAHTMQHDGYLPYSTGRLWHEEAEKFWETRERARAVRLPLYVVYSYVTPIAWAVEYEPAYCTPQSFSVTTSKGQNYVRAWINHRYPVEIKYVPPTPEYLAERERIFGKAV